MIDDKPLIERPKDIMGAYEVAGLLKIGRSTLGNWKNKPPLNFPEPVVKLKTGPIYDRRDILAWKRQAQTRQSKIKL